MFEPRVRQLDLEGIELSADLRLPPGARALVVFAHGSGSGRSSPRNRYVAESLARRGLGSLLFDLLTETEQRLDNRTRELRFDIALLARRLTEVLDWIDRDLELQSLRVGLFGASTGAAGCGARRGQPGRAHRSGGACAVSGEGTDPADRRRTGPGGVRPELPEQSCPAV
ncbi:Protein-L-isoaspartate O-methyltransferase [Pseudomonas chlororaphis subsp. aureofaciens]|uniref:Protein-L-isoaspartate O-methyltransferase n=1 Tax=Pseudomonas chlororaphis subsp. aureofaciens TaxID=587851 RepID=A0AAD0ZDI0_9PSED|nr:Protein-L-isoaspartate O-methyltransferase [Pseudomonas chlororaphis subsp. aureofaciens]AZE29876.1 Protein-L-isoaspartate O-methyltransferase [Pseudomonas chlororaphis subsp. aureofaciens]AZE36180.1 Protein-L-isoaspartate O-methyltransferase [Pseudomonas chlororaphis subsp. aureofaciens]AZE42524.1 Protein-L-isoaspartate O-methyltransferase [Pseudomonas chlororaphis subsp. aureofaciens]